LFVVFVLLFAHTDILFGQFSFPEGENRILRKRCIGFNTEAEAVRQFEERGGIWEMMTYSRQPVRHRVAVILAEFQPDNDPQTTGNGLFGDLPFFEPHPDSASAAEGKVVVDSTLNGRSKIYYQRHMIWMAQYFDAVSGGEFTIEEPDTITDITAIVRLSKEMGYYGDNNVFGLRQTEFVRDAIVAADTLTDIDFSLYDAVMVFHAGVGEESDFGPPPSYPGDSKP
jgi:hypothetical protein